MRGCRGGASQQRKNLTIYINLIVLLVDSICTSSEVGKWNCRGWSQRLVELQPDQPTRNTAKMVMKCNAGCQSGSFPPPAPTPKESARCHHGCAHTLQHRTKGSWHIWKHRQLRRLEGVRCHDGGLSSLEGWVIYDHVWLSYVVLEFRASSHSHGLFQRKVWDPGSPSPPGLTIQDNALLCAAVPVRLHERAPILCTFTFQRSQLLCAWKQQLFHSRLLRNVLPRTLAVLHFTSVAGHLGTETSPSTIFGDWHMMATLLGNDTFSILSGKPYHASSGNCLGISWTNSP